MDSWANGGSEAADERYRRLIDQSGVGLFQTRVDGSIGWLNQVAARIVGYDTPEEFMASVADIREIYIDPSRRDALLQILAHEGRVDGFEYEMRRKDGTRRWLSITARARHDADGNLEGFEGTFLDVTERKLFEAAVQAISSDLEPEEAVTRFAQVLGSVVPFRHLSLVAIEGDRYRRLVAIAGDPDGEPLPAGEWIDLAGNPVGEAVATRRPVVVTDTRHGRWVMDERLLEAGVRSYIVLPLSDGSRVIATFNVGFAEPGPVENDVRDLLVAHSAAVTQAVSNILLYEAQGEVVARLEEVARLKNEFFAAVSHDLKNPVSVITGVSEVLQASWDSIPVDRRKQMIDSMVRSSRAMKDMLQRDLDAALIESGELSYDIAPFDISDTARGVVDGYRDSEPGREFVLEVDRDLPLALGDPRRHSQILNNLLSNAVKFSEPDTTVTVALRESERMIEVSVADQGRGIGEEGRSVLFQRLSRLHPGTAGSGLGLYIARSMVEAQGGTIRVESEPGSGSRFIYTAPAVGK